MRLPILAAIGFGGLLAGCASIPLAPGAGEVKITQNPADVASCTPVGNIDSSHTQDPAAIDPTHAAVHEMQNQAIGAGGNVVFNTSHDGIGSGVIYRCETTPAGH